MTREQQNENKITSTPSTTLTLFNNDSFLSQFLEPDFDTTQFLRQKLLQQNENSKSSTQLKTSSLSSPSPQSIVKSETENFQKQSKSDEEVKGGVETSDVQRLFEGIKLINKELSAEVQGSHNELIQQVLQMYELEAELNAVRSEVTSLQQSAQRMHSSMTVPYESLKSRIQQLENMWETTELLRDLNLFLRSLQRLKQVIHGVIPSQKSNTQNQSIASFDMAKASQFLFEIEEILGFGTLKGIDIVTCEEEWIIQLGKEIRMKAHQSLEKGMKNLDQFEVATALQVFFNLKCLKEVVGSIINRMKSDVKSIFSKTLNTAVSSKSNVNARPGMIHRSNSSTGFDYGISSNQYLSQLKSALNEIHTLYVQVWHLDRMIAKKKDPITQTDFETLVLQSPQNISILESFYIHVTETLANELFSAMNKSQQIKSTIIAEYPEFSKIMHQFVEKLGEYTHFTGHATEDIIVHNWKIKEGISPRHGVRPKEWLDKILQPIENTYLDRSPFPNRNKP